MEEVEAKVVSNLELLSVLWKLELRQLLARASRLMWDLWVMIALFLGLIVNLIRKSVGEKLLWFRNVLGQDWATFPGRPCRASPIHNVPINL